jgi:hypothetical protein
MLPSFHRAGKLVLLLTHHTWPCARCCSCIKLAACALMQDFFPENGGKELAPFLRKLGSKRKVALADITADPFTFSLSFSGDRKPCCLKTDKLATYTVSGVKQAIDRYGQAGKVTLQFMVDSDGLLQLSEAVMTVEVEETIQVDKMVPDEEAGQPLKTSLSMLHVCRCVSQHPFMLISVEALLLVDARCTARDMLWSVSDLPACRSSCACTRP